MKFRNDPMVRLYDKTQEWLQESGRPFILVVGVIAGLVLLYTAGYYITSYRQSKAENALAAALAKYNAPVVDTPSPTNWASTIPTRNSRGRKPLRHSTKSLRTTPATTESSANTTVGPPTSISTKPGDSNCFSKPRTRMTSRLRTSQDWLWHNTMSRRGTRQRQ